MGAITLHTPRHCHHLANNKWLGCAWWGLAIAELDFREWVSNEWHRESSETVVGAAPTVSTQGQLR